MATTAYDLNKVENVKQLKALINNYNKPKTPQPAKIIGDKWDAEAIAAWKDVKKELGLEATPAVTQEDFKALDEKVNGKSFFTKVKDNSSTIIGLVGGWFAGREMFPGEKWKVMLLGAIGAVAASLFGKDSYLYQVLRRPEKPAPAAGAKTEPEAAEAVSVIEAVNKGKDANEAYTLMKAALSANFIGDAYIPRGNLGYNKEEKAEELAALVVGHYKDAEGIEFRKLSPAEAGAAMAEDPKIQAVLDKNEKVIAALKAMIEKDHAAISAILNEKVAKAHASISIPAIIGGGKDVEDILSQPGSRISSFQNVV